MLLVLLLYLIVCNNDDVLGQEIQQTEQESYQNYYFSYGPEMRPSTFLQIYPDAVFVETGCLQDARIDFINYDPENSDGGTVTVCEYFGTQVCGAVYQITPDLYQYFLALPEVDGGYKKLVYSDIMLTSDVTISAVFLTELQCPSAVFPGVGLPFSDLPSHEYVKTLIQSGLILRLPEIYLKDISYISDNSLVSL